MSVCCLSVCFRAQSAGGCGCLPAFPSLRDFVKYEVVSRCSSSGRKGNTYRSWPTFRASPVGAPTPSRRDSGLPFPGQGSSVAASVCSGYRTLPGGVGDPSQERLGAGRAFSETRRGGRRDFGPGLNLSGDVGRRCGEDGSGGPRTTSKVGGRCPWYPSESDGPSRLGCTVSH